jgi:hypothetical protein
VRTYLYGLCFALLGACGVLAYLYASERAKAETLALDKLDLSYRNAALERAKSPYSFQGLDPDAVTKANLYFGAPMEVIIAGRHIENGGFANEAGYHGKHKAVIDLYRANLILSKDWNYCEMSRRYTDFVWEWAMKPENRKSACDYIAKQYTGQGKAAIKEYSRALRGSYAIKP